jgi:hypothetical protein
MGGAPTEVVPADDCLARTLLDQAGRWADSQLALLGGGSAPGWYHAAAVRAGVGNIRKHRAAKGAAAFTEDQRAVYIRVLASLDVGSAAGGSNHLYDDTCTVLAELLGVQIVVMALCAEWDAVQCAVYGESFNRVKLMSGV